MELPWLISVLLFFLTIVTLVKLSTSQKNSKLPPGPPRLPIIGNLHQLAAKNSLPHCRMAELAREYGPIMYLRVGEVPNVVISSADMAREALRTHDAALCGRPGILMAEYMYRSSKDIAFSPYGDYWRQIRKVATLELFTAKRVKSFRPVREEEVTHLVKSIAMEEKEGSVVNLSHKIFALTFDIISRLVMSKKGKEQEEFKALLADVIEGVTGFTICDIYPSAKFLPLITGMRSKLQCLVKRSDKIIDPIIQEHISNNNQGQGDDDDDDDDDDRDMIDVLLSFHNKGLSQFSLTMDHIKSLALEVFFAGSETSSSVIEWVMSELLKNPRVMTKTQDEIRQVVKFQGKETVNETSLEDLKYFKQVIKETLRLHPPAPLLVPRESNEQCQIDGYKIPPKTRVLINAWAIGRDPKYWKDPERFNPERFENSSVDYKGNHFELIPFGAGRRICPGIGLGMANVEVPLVTLLYHFDWKLPNQMKHEDLNMDETFGISARRKHDLLVIPTLHSCSPLRQM